MKMTNETARFETEFFTLTLLDRMAKCLFSEEFSACLLDIKATMGKLLIERCLSVRLLDYIWELRAF